MNGSFLLLGVALLAGLLLLWPQWKQGWGSGLSRLLLLLGVSGWLLVGLFPADVNENLHVLGAFMIFFLANLSLLWTVFFLRGNQGQPARLWGAGLAVLGLAGTMLFFAGQSLGLGLGGMERVAAYSHLGALSLLSLQWLKQGL